MCASSCSLTFLLSSCHPQIETSMGIRKLALWSRSTGILTLTLEKDLTAQTNHVIRLIVKNPTSRPGGGDQGVTLSATLVSKRSGSSCAFCGRPVSFVKPVVFTIVQPSASFIVSSTWYESCSTADYEVTATFASTVLANCTAGLNYLVPIQNIDPETKIIEADSTRFMVSACDGDPLFVFASVAQWSRTAGLSLSLNKTVLHPNYCNGATQTAINEFDTSYTLSECLNNPIQTLTAHKVCFKLEVNCPLPPNKPATSTELVCVADSLILPSDSNEESQDCEFIIASITQSNPYPCHLNTLTVSFSTSKRMKRGTKVTIEGLTGTNTASTATLRISGASVANGGLEASADWKQTEGIVAVVLGQDMQTAKDVYSFSFEITNPSVEGAGKSTRLLRDAATVKIYANSICKASSVMQNDRSTCLFSIAQIYGARPGDAAPLVVLRPKMLTKKIGQSTPFAGCVSFKNCVWMIVPVF